MVILEGDPPPPTLPYGLHTGAVEIPERVAPVNGTVQKAGGKEATDVGGGGGTGGNLNGVQSLWAPP